MIVSAPPAPAAADAAATGGADAGTVPAGPFGQLLALLGGSPAGGPDGTIDAAKTLQALTTKLESMDSSTLDASTLAALSAEVDALKAELARQAAETARAMDALDPPGDEGDAVGANPPLLDISADAAVTIAAKVLMTPPNLPVDGGGEHPTPTMHPDADADADSRLVLAVEPEVLRFDPPTAPGPRTDMTNTAPDTTASSDHGALEQLLAATDVDAAGRSPVAVAGAETEAGRRPTPALPSPGTVANGNARTTGGAHAQPAPATPGASGADAAPAPDPIGPAPAGTPAPTVATLAEGTATTTTQTTVSPTELDRPATERLRAGAETTPRPDAQGLHGETADRPVDAATTDSSSHEGEARDPRTPGPQTPTPGASERAESAPAMTPLGTGAGGTGTAGISQETPTAAAFRAGSIENLNTPAVDAGPSPTATGATPLDGQVTATPAPQPSQASPEAIIRPMALSATTVEQLQDMLRGADARRRIVVRLDPPELGVVTLDLTALGDDVRLVARAETPEAVRALLRQQADVQQALAAHGMSLLDFDVHDGARQDGPAAEHDEQQRRPRMAGDLALDEAPIQIGHEQEGELFL